MAPEDPGCGPNSQGWGGDGSELMPGLGRCADPNMGLMDPWSCWLCPPGLPDNMQVPCDTAAGSGPLCDLCCPTAPSPAPLLFPVPCPLCSGWPRVATVATAPRTSPSVSHRVATRLCSRSSHGIATFQPRLCAHGGGSSGQSRVTWVSASLRSGDMETPPPPPPPPASLAPSPPFCCLGRVLCN
jgi:hypothetical protein